MIRWWGVQELLADLYDRPELVHKAIDKLVNAYLSMLDQFEQPGPAQAQQHLLPDRFGRPGVHRRTAAAWL